MLEVATNVILSFLVAKAKREHSQPQNSQIPQDTTKLTVQKHRLS